MKIKVILGSLICLTIGSLVGCGETSKEVELRDFENKKEIKVEHIKNDDNYNLAPKFYSGNEIYSQCFGNAGEPDVITVGSGDDSISAHKNLYKVSGDKILKTDKKNNAIGVFDSKIRGMDYTLDNNGTIKNIFYYDQDKGENKVVKELNLPREYESLKGYEGISTNLILGDSKTAYLMLHEGDITKPSYTVELIDVNTKKELNVNEKFERPIRWGFYIDNKYYLLDEGLNLYKLKKGNNELKVSEKIKLASKFKLNEEEGNFTIQNIYLRDNGEVVFKINNKLKYENHNWVQANEECIFKYNVKTDEFKDIDNGKDIGLELLAYNEKTENVLIRRYGKNKKDENYIGKIDGDKIELLNKINLSLDSQEYAVIIHSIFNDKGNELMLGYVRVISDTVMDEKMHYVRIKI